MTNIVYVITNGGSIEDFDDEESEQIASEPERILLRVYGAKSWMFDRSMEERLATVLNDVNVSPKWLGIFGNGRFEDFVPNNHVSAQQFRTLDVAKKIISSLATVHRLDKGLMEPCGNVEDGLWQRLQTWQDKAVEAANHLGLDIAGMEILKPSIIEGLRSSVESSAPSPLVFGHCDVL